MVTSVSFGSSRRAGGSSTGWSPTLVVSVGSGGGSAELCPPPASFSGRGSSVAASSAGAELPSPSTVSGLGCAGSSGSSTPTPGSSGGLTGSSAVYLSGLVAYEGQKAWLRDIIPDLGSSPGGLSTGSAAASPSAKLHKTVSQCFPRFS